MFTSSFQASSGRSQQFANLYRQVGVETGVSAATPHRLVQMLFDGLADEIGHARVALARGQIEAKGRHIGRAARIVEEGLRAGLNLKAGGELAANLHNLYGYVVMRLTHANLRNDRQALDEVDGLIAPLRDAWATIGERLPS
jgi:flagellar protein FliS